MIAGASWVWWLGFHAVVAALLVADLLLRGAFDDAPALEAAPAPASPPGPWRSHRRSRARAWLTTAALVLAAAGFAMWIAVTQGRQPALEFVGGYAIEISLSVDNLFVFLVIFQGFRITEQRQHDALAWGMGGAVVLRALFIAAGIALLSRFDWITWVFGLILLYAAWRLVRSNPARSDPARVGSVDAAVPKAPAAIRSLLRRLQPARGSLLPVILAVEVTDLLFAMDSRCAGHLAQSLRGLHVEHRGCFVPALPLFRAGLAAGSLPLPALWTGCDAGLCGAEDAGGPLDRGSDHPLAGHDGRDSDGVRCGFVVCGKQGAEAGRRESVTNWPRRLPCRSIRR